MTLKTVSVGNLPPGATVTVEVKVCVSRLLRARIGLAIGLIRLAGWVAGFAVETKSAEGGAR